MMRRAGFALLAVGATSLATLLACAPVSRLLSKGDRELWLTARELMWTQVLPCLAVGLALAAFALFVRERRPVTAVLLLIAAPVAVVLADFFLMAIP